MSALPPTATPDFKYIHQRVAKIAEVAQRFSNKPACYRKRFRTMLRRPKFSGNADNHRIFTARPASSAITRREISDWSIIRIFAQRDSTGTSVGEKAVLVLKARNR